MLLVSSARAAARWTASAAVFSQAEPVLDVRECSRPVVKNVQRQASGYWIEVVALAIHARHHVPNAPPGAEPAVERLEGGGHVGRDAREGGETEGREQ